MTITEEHTRPYGFADLPGLMGLMTGDEKHGPAATSTLDVLWVLHDRVLRVSPERAAALRRATGAAGTDVVLVEPYLAGTSTASADDALADVPLRVLGLGVGRRELRRYGQLEEHVAAHGLDAASLRQRIAGFVAG